MMDYRCYRTDANGNIVAVESFQCSSDEAACHRAGLIALNLTWKSHELWQLARKVICPISI
jgi:hypothetical protein